MISILWFHCKCLYVFSKVLVCFRFKCMIYDFHEWIFFSISSIHSKQHSTLLFFVSKSLSKVCFIFSLENKKKKTRRNINMRHEARSNHFGFQKSSHFSVFESDSYFCMWFWVSWFDFQKKIGIFSADIRLLFLLLFL